MRSTELHAIALWKEGRRREGRRSRRNGGRGGGRKEGKERE